MHVQNGLIVDIRPLGCTVSHSTFTVLHMFSINSLRIANCMFVEVWKLYTFEVSFEHVFIVCVCVRIMVEPTLRFNLSELTLLTAT